MLKRTLSLILAALALTVSAAEPEKSVVQITTFSQTPNWSQPWRFNSVRQAGGTGFVISGKRIMTNAHVIGWGREILVKRYQDPRPYRARVKYVAHECDLAILEVEDESFFDSMEPQHIGELPYVRSTVTTYGYPAGGQQISYTKGVVSRIEMQNYVHVGNRAFLTVQTDAAINPGNSGGPVIQDGHVVGVAFQGIPGLENAGFFIPPSVINHFLEDVQDAKYDGFPMAGISISPLQNPAYRKMLKLDETTSGARIDTLVDTLPASKVLKPDDVLLEVNGHEVGSDGSIIYQKNRVSASVAFQEAQVGEKVNLKIWRDGKEIETEVSMAAYNEDRKEGSQYDVLPRYFVYSGLVFVPLNLDYLRSAGGAAGNEQLIYELSWRRREKPKTVREEPIVLANILAHEVNADMGVRGGALINKINGVKINKLEDVIKAFESSEEKKHVIEFMGEGSFEALDRAAADKAHKEILDTHGVQNDRRL